MLPRPDRHDETSIASFGDTILDEILRCAQHDAESAIEWKKGLMRGNQKSSACARLFRSFHRAIESPGARVPQYPARA